MSQYSKSIARTHKLWQRLGLCILMSLCITIASPLPAAADTLDTDVVPVLATQKASSTKKKSIKKAKVSKVSAKTYTGKKITPKPTVKLGNKKLKRGRDYTLSYRNNKSVGTATIIIKGKGKYKGTKKVTFKIRRKASTGTTAVVVSGGSSSTSSSSGSSGTQPAQSSTVYATATGECYHRDGCSSLSRSKIPLSRSEAIARGLRPCSRCNP